MGTGPPIIATPNWSDPATILTQAGFDAQAPAENLQKMQPSTRAQSTGLDGGIEITMDRGEISPLNLASLLFSNCSAMASIRHRGANVVGDLDTDPGLDTSAKVAANGFGSHVRFQGDDQYAGAISLSAIPAFTIEMLIRPDRIRSQDIWYFHQGLTQGFLLSMRADGKLIAYRLPGPTGNLVSMTVPSTSEFLHVAISYDSTLTRLRLLVDGVVEGESTSVTDVARNGFLLAFPIGSASFAGGIDDVRIFDIERTPAQIAATKDAELSGSEPNLLHYWKFNEKAGATALNEKVGPNITLVGSPLPLWSFPTRFWASPDLESWAKTHSLWFYGPGQAYRYWRTEVLDPQNPDGFLYFGRYYLSAAHQFTRGIRYGSNLLGWIDPSSKRRTPGGQTLVRRINPIPAFELSLLSESEDEMTFNVDNVHRLRGGSRDVLWVLQPHSEAYRHRSMIYGTGPMEMGVPHSNYGLWEYETRVEGLQ